MWWWCLASSRSMLDGGWLNDGPDGMNEEGGLTWKCYDTFVGISNAEPHFGIRLGTAELMARLPKR